MDERTQRLRELFLSMAPEATFTERQTERRGTVWADRDVDAAIEALVAEMRTRYGFRTKLSDAQLVTVVRGFYAGRTDRDIARDLGEGSLGGVVARARVNLHLFRAADLTATFDLARLERLVDDGVSTADAAAELDVSDDTVARYRRVLDARREARRINHRYQTEFENLLSTSRLDEEIREHVHSDRRTFDLVHE